MTWWQQVAGGRIEWRGLRPRIRRPRPDWRALRLRLRAALPWRDWLSSIRTAVRDVRRSLRATVAAAGHMARRNPGWLRAVACVVAFVLTVAAAMAFANSVRRGAELELALERARADSLQRALDAASARYAAELAGLRDQLAVARNEVARTGRELIRARLTIADFEARQRARRLSYEEKRALIAALAPYRGETVSVAAMYGDEDAKVYAEDVVQVLDAAGWRVGGTDAISFHRWDRTPLGIEITLNESDARAGRVSAGVGALINAARRLGLVDGNTVFMNAEVPPGQVQLRVGHRLARSKAD